jgi:hypothetical protein
MLQRRALLLALPTLLVGSWAIAQSNATIDPAQAGPDYRVQGEYLGKAEGKPFGAQVIALGEGKFQAVFLPGGLPGEGWDATTRIRVDGKTEGAKTTFAAGNGWSGALQGETFEGKTDGGKEFSLKKLVRKSKSMGKKPPQGALVLFDGSNTDAWVDGRMTDDRLLMEGTQTKQNFKDFSLHLEFMTSFMPQARGQGRSNSGVFLDGRYEIQVLDSFGLNGENNECGSVYSIIKPAVNMCLPPITWQTYDIDFEAPVFDAEGKKTKSAVVTVHHNGVMVHDKVEIPRSTVGAPEGPALGPIQCMNHGNPVRYRNIWVVEKK